VMRPPVVLMPDPPEFPGYSAIIRRNGFPPRILFHRNLDRIFTDTGDGRLRTAGQRDRFRWSDTGSAVNENPPVPKAAAIASPTADVAALKAAVDAIRAALRDFGITA
jgi:hypothetical protein